MTKVIAKYLDCFSPLTAAEAKAIKAAGYDGVLRYLGHYTHPAWGKGISKEEAQTTLHAGLAILPIWEGSKGAIDATKPDFFAAGQGALDGGQALHEMQMVGFPEGTPVFFAVDFGAEASHMQSIQAYRNAATKGLAGKYKGGIYGGYNVMEHIEADAYWQTIAWSGGRVSSKACMLQAEVDKTVAGVSVDINHMFHDPGAWTLTPKPAPAPKEHWNVVVGWFDSEEQAAAAAKEITMLHHWHTEVEKAKN